MPNSEPQEDLDRLLKEYDSTSTNGQGQWTNFHREPGCSRTALRRCFVVTFLCLIGVSVGWFLHVNVFMDNPLPNATSVQTSLLSSFGDPSSGSNGLMDMVTKSGILDEINMTAVIDYMMKHIPPELAAKLLTHVSDLKNGDFLKVFQDTQLMDGILDFLDVPDDFPGLGKKQKKVDDYDYDDEEVPQKTTLAHSVPTRQVSRNKVSSTTVKSTPGLSKQDNLSLTDTLKKMLFNKNKGEGIEPEDEESLESEEVIKLKKSELEKSKLELQLQLLQEELNREKKVNKVNKKSHSDNEMLLNSGHERDYRPPVFGPSLPHEYPNEVYVPHNENYDVHNMNQGYQGYQRYPPQQQLPSDQYLSQQLDVRGWHQQQQQLHQFPFQQQLPFHEFQPVQHNQQVLQQQQHNQQFLPQQQQNQQVLQQQQHNQQVLQQLQHNQQVLQQQHFKQQQQQLEQSSDQKQQEQTQTQQPSRLSFNFGQPPPQKLQQESVQQPKQQEQTQTQQPPRLSFNFGQPPLQKLQQESVEQPKQQQSLIQQLKQESLLKQLQQPMKQDSQQALKQAPAVQQDSQPPQQPLRQSQVQQLTQEQQQQTHEEKPFSLLSPMDILQQFLQSNPESRMQKDKLDRQLDKYENKADIPSSTDQPTQNKPAGLSSLFPWNRDLYQLAPKQVEKANLKYKDWSNVWDLTNSEVKKV